MLKNTARRRSTALLAGVVGFCVSVLALSAPAAAQSVAGIIGVVSDSSAAILPGVTVTATGPALQVPSIVAVTDAKGEYRLSPLPPGTYTVTFELPGFQTVKRENVRLALGFTATLDQALGLGTVQESVTVSGASPLVDVTNPATSVDMSAEALEILPTNRDGLKAFMGTMPGVRTNLSVGASDMSDTVQFRSYGQSGQSWQMLDGVMFSTPNTGGANGSHVDFNALDSTRVQTVGSAPTSAVSSRRLALETSPNCTNSGTTAPVSVAGLSGTSSGFLSTSGSRASTATSWMRTTPTARRCRTTGTWTIGRRSSRIS
jgi:hypothetical protein